MVKVRLNLVLDKDLVAYFRILCYERGTTAGRLLEELMKNELRKERDKEKEDKLSRILSGPSS